MAVKYKVLTVDHFLNENEKLTVEESLNKYGSDGWELVGILQKAHATLGEPSKLECDLVVFKKSC